MQHVPNSPPCLQVTAGETTYICVYLGPTNWTTEGQYVRIATKVNADKMTRIRVPNCTSSCPFFRFLGLLSFARSNGFGFLRERSSSMDVQVLFQRFHDGWPGHYRPAHTRSGARRIRSQHGGLILSAYLQAGRLPRLYCRSIASAHHLALPYPHHGTDTSAKSSSIGSTVGSSLRISDGGSHGESLSITIHRSLSSTLCFAINGRAHCGTK